MRSISEKLLEDEISGHLVAAGGYRACKVGTDPEWRQDFDARLGLDTVELFAFIELTRRAPEWEQARQGPRRRGGTRTPQVRPAARAADRRARDGRRPAARRPRPERRDPLSYRKPAFGAGA